CSPPSWFTWPAPHPNGGVMALAFLCCFIRSLQQGLDFSALAWLWAATNSFVPFVIVLGFHHSSLSSFCWCPDSSPLFSLVTACVHRCDHPTPPSSKNSDYPQHNSRRHLLLERSAKAFPRPRQNQSPPVPNGRCTGGGRCCRGGRMRRLRRRRRCGGLSRRALRRRAARPSR